MTVRVSEARPRRAGDVVASATKAAGVRPCGGCRSRQGWLNRLDVIATMLAFHLTYPAVPKRWRKAWSKALSWRGPG